MEKIEIEADALMKQAPEVIRHYLARFCNDLDTFFEEGYAKHNPVLLGACILAAAIVYQTDIDAAIAQDTQDRVEGVAFAVKELSSATESVANAVEALLAKAEEVTDR